MHTCMGCMFGSRTCSEMSASCTPNHDESGWMDGTATPMPWTTHASRSGWMPSEAAIGCIAEPLMSTDA